MLLLSFFGKAQSNTLYHPTSLLDTGKPTLAEDTKYWAQRINIISGNKNTFQGNQESLNYAGNSISHENNRISPLLNNSESSLSRLFPSMSLAERMV
jgi:hypothetical protein